MSAAKTSWFTRSTLLLGFAFLYLPMLILIVYSFNENRLVTKCFDLLHKWCEFVKRNADQLDMHARGVGAPVFAADRRSHVPYGRLGGEYFSKRRDVLGANLQFGPPFAPALNRAVDHFVECFTTNAEPCSTGKKCGEQTPARSLFDHA